MKKIQYFIALVSTIFIVGCSSPQLIVVKEPTLQPQAYSKPLFVAEKFSSNKSSFSKLFNGDVNTQEKVGKINADVLQKIAAIFTNEGKSINTHLLDINIDGNKLILNEQNTDPVQTEIERLIDTNKHDLVITIYTEDIQQNIHYNNNINYGGGFNNGGFGFGASIPSRSISYNYIITAVDTKTQLEIWKAKYNVNNAANIFSNTAKCVAGKISEQILKDQLF